MRKLVCLLAFVMLVALSACGNTSGSEITTTKIQTPYVTLTVPESFVGNVTLKNDADKNYTFLTSDGDEIFTISFVEEKGDLIGTLILEDKNAAVYSEVPTVNADNENYQKICEYQEGLATIIENLVNEENFIIGKIVEGVGGTFDIETPFVTLKYPNKWKDVVKVEVTDDSVKFTNGEVALFDIVFHDGEGNLLGTYKDTPLYFVEHPVDTDEQGDMIADINVIIENLQKDTNFVMPQ